jgi:ABC-type transporter lipoprotein component MlaA
MFNILLLLIFIRLLSVYFSFNNIDFKHMGIILIIAYITSLAVEAKLFITGAVLNAIVVYIYVRILLLKNRETVKEEKKRERERERRIVDEIREINESWINFGN